MEFTVNISRKNSLLFGTLFSCIICVLIWYFVLHVSNRNILTISFLNIGQGDSIYVETPNGNQIVIDGGPGPVDVEMLGSVMPWYDHSINMLIVTNPDADHFAGFIDVLKKFSVSEVVEPGTFNKSETYKTLEDLIKQKNIQEVLGFRGMTFVLDKTYGVYLEILFPDRDVSKETSNDGSMVAKLVYGDESIMLMGDATAEVEQHLLETDPKELPANILKLGHHGSRTSSSEAFLEKVKPEYAIISAGLNNKFGHPHKEVTDRLEKLHIPYLITFKEGTITFETDGKKLLRM